MTVRIISVRTEEPAWTEWTPTTASVRPSGPVRPCWSFILFHLVCVWVKGGKERNTVVCELLTEQMIDRFMICVLLRPFFFFFKIFLQASFAQMTWTSVACSPTPVRTVVRAATRPVATTACAWTAGAAWTARRTLMTALLDRAQPAPPASTGLRPSSAAAPSAKLVRLLRVWIRIRLILLVQFTHHHKPFS